MPTASAPAQGDYATLLDWLSSQPHPETEIEIAALAAHLGTLGQTVRVDAQYQRCLELFYSRALRLAAEFRHELRRTRQPLPRDLAQGVQRLIAALGKVAEGFLSLLDAVARGQLPATPRLYDAAAARGLRMLTEQFALASQLATAPPAGLWARAWRLHMVARQGGEHEHVPGSPAETALFAYKRLLAVSTVEPHSLTAGEFDWVYDYLGRIGSQLHLQTERPPSTEGSWYWVQAEHDSAPRACVREEPPTQGDLLYFSSAVLARRAAEALSRIENNALNDTLPIGLGSELAPSDDYPGVQPTALLGRLRQRWSMPERREQIRRPHHYLVQVCSGLDAIWRTLRHPAQSNDVVEWEVLNESPGGYSIMHLAGGIRGLSAGMAIAMRRDAAHPWNLCVVRWLRNEANTPDGEERIEIGLQTLSAGAIPVSVGFRGSGRSGPMVNALVLPVLPALRHHQAVLAPAGTYTSRRFSLVSDVDRVYIAQGRLLSLDMQTSNVELFQFEIDPYPI